MLGDLPSLADEDRWLAKLPVLIHPFACECVLCEVCSSDDGDTDIKIIDGPSSNEPRDDSDKENN